MTLCHTHIEFYRENGYLIIEKVLDAERLNRFRARIDELAAEAASVTQSDERFDLESGHSPDASRIFRINRPDRFYPEFRELAADPVIMGILEGIVTLTKNGPNFLVDHEAKPLKISISTIGESPRFRCESN